ncbi:MAG: hypothetical protein ACI90V_006477, partial [Bacillariaceae sp.]|jgi:hypothetical protein
VVQGKLLYSFLRSFICVHSFDDVCECEFLKRADKTYRRQIEWMGDSWHGNQRQKINFCARSRVMRTHRLGGIVDCFPQILFLEHERIHTFIL